MSAPSPFGQDLTNKTADGAGIKLEQLKTPSNEDIAAITRLWIATGLIPAIRDARQDIESCISANNGSLIVARRPEDQQIFATMMTGHDGVYGWVHYLAIAKHAQGSGIGSELVALAEDILRLSGLGEIRITIENAAAGDFYAKLGYDFIGSVTDQHQPDPQQNKIMRKSLVQ
ncbi:GNAT family N-acetyltransferase [Thalassospira sp. HF15]|uniref:GNAT family N-acetyltransferase n=1 Tax=Thalassospira sp. HF15 TaxID=2722755 RepID=UPI00143019AD|nr:GNAT family N-acetyltransferase [Thalassospira sp. HF15]NIY74610.1 GNAT family N-acetyltransferase [Thalassospira sp. HF15]